MLPYYPFFWGDYFSKTADLSQTQHGAFMLFLRHIYGTGKVIEDKKRYHIAMAFTEEERESADYVLKRFFKESIQDGLKIWRNEKCEKVIKEADEKHLTNSKRAEKAANARWGKESNSTNNAPSIASSNSSSNSQEMPEQCQPKTQNPKPKAESLKLPPNPPTVENSVDNFAKPLSSVIEKGVGVLKQSFKGEGWSVNTVMHQLDDKTLQKAKDNAKGWDIYELANIYVAGINDGKRDAPNSVKAAFPAWCAKYTKGNAP